MLAAVAVVALALPVRTANVRIVLIAGRPSHPAGMHEFRAGSMLLQKALASVPGVTADVYTMGWPTKTVDGKTVDDNAALETANAVLIFADGGKGHPAIQGDRMKVIDALEAKGVGLGFAHYGVEVPAGVPGEAMHRWSGGYYETNFSVNPMWAPDVRDVSELIRSRAASGRSRPTTSGTSTCVGRRTRGGEGTRSRRFSRPSRATTCATGRTCRRAARTRTSSRTAAGSETMMWVYERPNGGRSFGFTGGHTHSELGRREPAADAMLNALLWIAKADVPAARCGGQASRHGGI